MWLQLLIVSGFFLSKRSQLLVLNLVFLKDTDDTNGMDIHTFFLCKSLAQYHLCYGMYVLYSDKFFPADFSPTGPITQCQFFSSIMKRSNYGKPHVLIYNQKTILHLLPEHRNDNFRWLQDIAFQAQPILNHV